MLTIRRACAGDRYALLGLYRQLLPSDEPSPADAELDAVWQEILARPGVLVFVGESQGVVVATCTLVVVPNLTRGARPYSLIENVVVHSDHRRRGYGDALMRHAISSAWSAECYKVMLLTGRDQTHDFYEGVGLERGVKTGFVVYAQKP